MEVRSVKGKDCKEFEGTVEHGLSAYGVERGNIHEDSARFLGTSQHVADEK